MTQLVLVDWFWFYVAGSLIYLCGFARAVSLSTDAWDADYRFECVGNAILWPVSLICQVVLAIALTVRWLTRLRIVVAP